MTSRVDARFTLLLYLARTHLHLSPDKSYVPTVDIKRNPCETMRLLRYINIGELTITNFVDKDAIPAFAILLHRWLDDDEEPTFEDLRFVLGRESLSISSSGSAENKRYRLAYNILGWTPVVLTRQITLNVFYSGKRMTTSASV